MGVDGEVRHSLGCRTSVPRSSLSTGFCYGRFAGCPKFYGDARRYRDQFTSKVDVGVIFVEDGDAPAVCASRKAAPDCSSEAAYMGVYAAYRFSRRSRERAWILRLVVSSTGPGYQNLRIWSRPEDF